MPVYHQIQMAHKTPILPNLQKLISTSLAHEAFVFAPPSLRYIRFESDDNTKTLKLLSDVAWIAPELDTLRVDLKHEAGSKVYENLGKLKALRTLDLVLKTGSLSDYIEFDKTLARSPLVKLRIALPVQWERDILMHGFVSGFEKLDRLSIKAGFNVIVKAVSRVRSSSLSGLCLTGVNTTGGDGPKLDWKPLINLIFRRWASSLEVINLDLQNTSPPTDFHSVFASLPNLRVLLLRGYSPIKITDEDVLVLAKNSASIEVLYLVSEGDMDNVAPSLRSLSHLANHCPKLKILEMSLSSDDILLPHEVASSAGRQKALRYLEVYRIPLWSDSPCPGYPQFGLSAKFSKAYAIARYLDRIFVRLEYVSHKSQGPLPDPCWEGVKLLVRMFQAVHHQKRGNLLCRDGLHQADGGSQGHGRHI
ncbi:hypothetical protein C8R44DRAFT_741312 [Mycena epipterygia]|nr:hypothetical protein C8R44DRAFT_741312 [Mycena epipterygia]